MSLGVLTEFCDVLQWWINLREREHLGDFGVDGRALLK